MKFIALKENYSTKVHMVRPEHILRVECYEGVHTEVWFNNGQEKINIDKSVDVFETLRRAGLVDEWVPAKEKGTP